MTLLNMQAVACRGALPVLMEGVPSMQSVPAQECAQSHRPAAMCSPATHAQGTPALGGGLALAAHASAQTE